MFRTVRGESQILTRHPLRCYAAAPQKSGRIVWTQPSTELFGPRERAYLIARGADADQLLRYQLIAFVGRCSLCQKAPGEPRKNHRCRGCMANGIVSEYILIDREAGQADVMITPRTLEAFARERHTRLQLAQVQSQHEQQPLPIEPGKGVVALLADAEAELAQVAASLPPIGPRALAGLRKVQEQIRVASRIYSGHRRRQERR